MAERIQLELEQSLTDLNFLERQDVFSQTEIKGLLTQRKDFETRMIGFKSKPIDFLEAIEFESKFVIYLFRIDWQILK